MIQVNHRDDLRKYLEKKSIGTAIHYPIPIHLQPASKYLGYKKGSFPKTEMQAKKILTIPIHQNLETRDLKKIAFNLNQYAKTKRKS